MVWFLSLFFSDLYLQGSILELSESFLQILWRFSNFWCLRVHFRPFWHYLVLFFNILFLQNQNFDHIKGQFVRDSNQKRENCEISICLFSWTVNIFLCEDPKIWAVIFSINSYIDYFWQSHLLLGSIHKPRGQSGVWNFSLKATKCSQKVAKKVSKKVSKIKNINFDISAGTVTWPVMLDRAS